MIPETDYIYSLFASVGVTPTIALDENNCNLIIIENAHFSQLREWIELWLRPVAQDSENTYLRERLPTWSCVDLPMTHADDGKHATPSLFTLR